MLARHINNFKRYTLFNSRKLTVDSTVNRRRSRQISVHRAYFTVATDSAHHVAYFCGKLSRPVYMSSNEDNIFDKQTKTPVRAQNARFAGPILLKTNLHFCFCDTFVPVFKSDTPYRRRPAERTERSLSLYSTSEPAVG